MNAFAALHVMLTMSSSVSRVILKMSPCSVWARKKNMDLVLCVAEQTKIIPLSGSSKSFCQESKQRSLVEKNSPASADVISLTELLPFRRCLKR